MIKRKSAHIFLVVWLILSSILAPEGKAAGTSVKTFDFGAGGDNPAFRSHARTFPAPQGVAIAVAVNYRVAGGAATAAAALPIVIEIEDGSGKLAATREAVAEKNAQRVVINLRTNENTIDGCAKAWQVRVRTKSGDVPAARVFGDISFGFVDPAAAPVDVEGEAINLGKGKQVLRQIGSNDSFRHPGVMNVKAGWLDSLAALVLPLKFEILRPDGTIAKSLVGYGTNSNGNPKIDFNYHVTIDDAKQNGVWRLKITNNAEHDIIEIDPKLSFTKKCIE
jgi:hypothetical protein